MALLRKIVYWGERFLSLCSPAGRMTDFDDFRQLNSKLKHIFLLGKGSKILSKSPLGREPQRLRKKSQAKLATFFPSHAQFAGGEQRSASFELIIDAGIK